MRLRAIGCTCFLIATAGMVEIKLARAQAQNPSSGESRQAQAESAAPESSAEFDRIAKLANEAREAARVADAIAHYQEGLRLKPDWDEGRFYLGTLYYSVDRHTDALQAFRHLVARQPKHGPTWAFLGLCELELRDYERALNDLQKARTLGLGDNPAVISVARYNHAILLTRFEKFDEAFEVLREFGHEQNEDPSVVEAIGLSVLRMPYLPAELPPDKRELVLTAGRAAFKAASGRGEEADRLYQELILRYSEIPNVHYAYGYFLITSQPDKAVEQFRRELAISPYHVAARLQLAFEFFRLGDHKTALPFAQQAVELAPNLFGPRKALGFILLENGEAGRAVPELERAAKLEPESPEVRYALARAYTRVGRKKDAARERAEFQRLDAIQRAQRHGPQAVGGTTSKPGEPSPQ